MTEPPNRPRQRIRFWLLHAALLAALCLLDAPFIRSFRVLANAYRPPPIRVARIGPTTSPDTTVQINTVSNATVIATQEIDLEPGRRLTVQMEDRSSRSRLRNVSKRLLDHTFWGFFEQFGLAYAALLLAIFIWQQDPKHRKYLVLLILGLVLSAIVVWFIQHMTGKFRPKTAIDAPTFLPFPQGWAESSGLCFPSGHTTAAFALATFLAFLYPSARRLFYVTAALTGISRVVFQAHWPSDVYAGALVGYAVTHGLSLRFNAIETRLLSRFPRQLRAKLGV